MDKKKAVCLEQMDTFGIAQNYMCLSIQNVSECARKMLALVDTSI